MSDYKPGAVAMVTFRAGHPDAGSYPRPLPAIKHDNSLWNIYPSGTDHGLAYGEGAFSTIEPAVIFPATREDADVLCAFANSRNQGGGFTLAARIANAIREQIPEPKPQKRWTAGFVFLNGSQTWTVFDHARPTDICGGSLEQMRKYADALNAAEVIL